MKIKQGEERNLVILKDNFINSYINEKSRQEISMWLLIFSKIIKVCSFLEKNSYLIQVPDYLQ